MVRALGLVLLATQLVAAPALADEALARKQFRRGVELYDRARYAEALAAFEDAYREKPSAGIKQNIALSLKGLDRPADAATAFDDALSEGKETLKPETRAAIERELAALEHIVTTVRLAAVDEAHTQVDASITVEPAGQRGRVLVPQTWKRPLRLLPGIYTFSARAAGYADPAPKKLALVVGPAVDATFLFVTANEAVEREKGTLTVTTEIVGATIAVDGVTLGHGSWSGRLAAGRHAITVAAPGWKTAAADVTVPTGASVEYPVRLLPVSEAPPPYGAPFIRTKKAKRFTVAAGLSIDSASYRLGVPLGEPPPSGSRRDEVGGLSFALRGGWFVSKVLSLEIFGEVGASRATYTRPVFGETTTEIRHYEAMPMLRVVTPGAVRFEAATGFGVHRLSVESDRKSGAGTNASWRAEAGVQLDLGAVFLEALLFVDVHGVGSVRDDDPPAERLLYASPAARGGARLGIGLPF